MIQTIAVHGMTCEHSERSTETLGELDGVHAVDADHASGRVDLELERPLDAGMLAVALDEAGYDLA